MKLIPNQKKNRFLTSTILLYCGCVLLTLMRPNERYKLCLEKFHFLCRPVIPETYNCTPRKCKSFLKQHSLIFFASSPSIHSQDIHKIGLVILLLKGRTPITMCHNQIALMQTFAQFGNVFCRVFDN